MIKKLGTLALAAAVTLLGFQAPANAAASDPVAGSVVGTYVGFTLPLSTTVQVTAGVTSIGLSKSWTPSASDIATLAGKTVGFQATVTQPNGTSVPVSTSMGGSSNGISASMSMPSISFSGNPGTTPVQNMYPATTLTLPNDVSGYNSGYLNASLNILNRNSSGLSPLPVGNWTVNLVVTVNNTPVTETNTLGGSWAVSSMSSLSESANGTSAVAPAGATGVNASARVCVDPTLIATSDVLTGSVSINGTASNSPSVNFMWKTSNGSSRPSQSGTVVASDLTNGLYAQVYGNLGAAPVAGNTYTSAFTLLKGATNVTGNCAPAAPAKPTLAFSNGSFQVGYVLPVGADSYSTVCSLYDVTDTTTAVASGPGNSQTNSCALGSGTIVGHSYIAKVSAGWQGYAQSADSAPSDPVIKPALGYTFTSPVSGVTNVGGKLSRVSNSLAADSNTGVISSFSDGASGVVTLETEQAAAFGTTTSAAFLLRHVTKSGADGSFAGTGSVNIAPATGLLAGAGRFGWYGANHANWAFAYGTYDPMAMATNVSFTTGSFASATSSNVTVDNSVLVNACTATYGAGLTNTVMSMGPSIPSVQVVPSVSSTPLYLMNCFKTVNNMGQITNLANPILFTVTNATTVNVVKALITPSITVNNAQVYFSSNPNAGANDAAVTFVVIQSLTSSASSVVAARSVINMTPGFTFTASAGTYTPSGSEPVVKLAALNDGVVWGLLVGSSSTQLLKIAGDTVTATNLNADTVTGFTNSVFSMPIGLQAGSTAGIELVRTSSPGGSVAMASVDPATGSVTTAEVASYSVVSGGSVMNAYFVASNNLYWLLSEIASPTTYSLYKWLDLNFHLTAQTIAWANNNPTTLSAGGTATVSATATSALAVSYGTVDGSICTVNASTGVVTAVASTGNCVVTADQAGNGTYDSAPQVTLTLAIQKSSQTINWTTSPTSVTVGSTVTVAATASSNLAVTYGTTDSAACTVSASGVVTPVATTGNCVVTANQAGNGTYSAAPQKTLTLAITAVQPAKSAPKAPTVATKVKAGKIVVIALSATGGSATAGANSNGLATTVVLASGAKGFCSVTAVKKAGKVTGYAVKGLKVNATKCAVTINIVGNNLFNSLTKTVKVNVTK